mmetsp:Transcript_71002/g.197235  ORF Transcript_71002/g.197235 Transcript_71002/m.197235 type:complete len:291 (-) Transcript_71002:95-967(-)
MSQYVAVLTLRLRRPALRQLLAVNALALLLVRPTFTRPLFSGSARPVARPSGFRTVLGAGAGAAVAQDGRVRLESLRASDEQADKVWAAYCQAKGDGVVDAEQHSTDFLEHFLKVYGGDKASDDMIARLIPLYQAHPEPWQKYCLEEGIGVYDPRLLAASFVQRFLTEQGPFLKVDDTAPQETVERMVSLLDADAEARELWDAYCGKDGSGTKDPGNHTNTFLRRFMMTYAPGRASEDEVARIAAMRRTDPVLAERWSHYCAQEGVGVLDASKLPAYFVRKFLAASPSGV